MQFFISHQSISCVLLLNGASYVSLPGAGSESTTITVNNSTQPVCKVFTVYRHQWSDQLLNYQECQERHASILENGSEEYVHVKRFVPSCIRHRLASFNNSTALVSE